VTARVALSLSLLLAFAFVATSCSNDHTTTEGTGKGTHTYLFGDSLVFQAKDAWSDLMLKQGGYRVSAAGLAGSSTCQWFDTMAKERDEFHPKIVAMSFSGNALAPCMKNADGTPLSDSEYVARYTADTRRAIETFGPKVTFYLVGAPVSGGGDDRVSQIYRKLAPQYPNVHFVDGGKYLTPNHHFALTLPCLAGEQVCNGPVVNGVHTNIVRSPDHAHFCPVDPGFGKPCTVYSSGAYRFALVIAQAIEQGPR
jgi:uncharacterized protein YodC (DUF2158 family)